MTARNPWIMDEYLNEWDEVRKSLDRLRHTMWRTGMDVRLSTLAAIIES